MQNGSSILESNNKKRSPNTTHKIMSAIPSKNTSPELLLRHALWKKGMRYRINYKALKGTPDIVFTRARIVIFCDGDFWHGHNWALRGYSCFEEELSHYSDYWKNKLITNVNRDKAVTQALTNDGWIVLRFWESDIKSNLTNCVEIIESTYKDALSTRK